jgi:hypothetical protein
LLLRSEEFDNSYWIKVNSTIEDNIIISPNGELNCDKITENSGGSLKYVTKSGFATVGTYSFSVYVKPNGRNFVLLSLYDGVADRGAYFNVLNGTIGTIIGGATASIESSENGFYRCTITATIVNTFSTNIQICLSDAVRNYTGDGVSGLYIWGAQLESGAFGTSYIPTYDTSVTRTNEGLALSDLTTNNIVSATGGTWFVHLLDNIPITKNNSTPTDRGLFIADSSAGTTNSINIRRLTNGTLKRIEIAKVVGGSTTGNIYTTTSDEVKLVIRYNVGVAGGFDVFENGVKVITTSAFTGDSPLTYIGTRTSTSALESPFINIKSMALFNTQLSDAEAIQLTTL